MTSEMLTLGNGESKKYQKAELRRKRLVISAELEENTHLSTSTVKHLCSTDEITAERKYQAPFTFTPSHQLVLLEITCLKSAPPEMTKEPGED